MDERKSKIIKSDHFSWDEVEKQQYKTSDTGFRHVHRYSLLGHEIPDLNFHTRYFEIQPDGYSSLEMHRHPHSVVIIRGSGSVILDDELHKLKLHDVVFVAPGTIHQFFADQKMELGFLCMVDRYRDKPVVPDQKLIRERIKNPDVLQKIRV
jgi:quercetin dioxygenase-like cupin family protein